MPVLRRDQRLGVVYTPREVAAPMVRLALEPLLRGKSAAQLAALRVCDFAVGEGVFLDQAATVIADAMRERGVGDPRAAAAACLAGVDIDAAALATARRALGGDLRVANALELDWPAAFPEVFAAGGFDAVIGNPPYIRQEQLADKQALRGYRSYDGVADLYIYFIELASRIVRPGGRYCVIVPNKWLTVEYGRRLRGVLAEQRSVEQIVDLGRMPLFADADAFPCIVSGTVGMPGEPLRPELELVRTGRATTGDVATALANATGTLTRQGDSPWYLDAPADRALISRLEQRWPGLGELFPRPSRGIVTGCNRAFVIDRPTRDRLLAESPHSTPLVRALVKGRDIRRWHTAPIDRFLLLIDHGTDLADHPAIARHLAQFRDALEPRPPDHRGDWAGRKPGSYRWFELQDPVGEVAASRAPRLFYQDIQTGPACALDRSGELVPDTTVWTLPTDDRCLLAILNSSLYGWYARNRFPPALNGAVRPKLAYLREMPIATATGARRAALEALVDARLAGAEVDADIDLAVLDLYELGPAERELIS